MHFLIERITLSDAFRREEDWLRGQGAVIVAVSSGSDESGFHMAHLCTTHEFHVVLLGKPLVPFEHRLPCPLVGMPLCVLNHTTVGEDALAFPINHISGICLCFSHGIRIVTGITS